MKLENITIGQVLSDKVKTMPDENAIEYENVFYTWEELDKISNKFAMEFLEYGIGHDTHVAIWSTNTPNWIVTYLALAKIGAISVLINPNYKERELSQILEYSDVQYVCYGDFCENENCTDVVANLKKKSIGKIKQYIYIGQNKSSKCGKTHILEELTFSDMEILRKAKSKVTPQNVASIVFTSGTTSMPKGVMLTHYQLMNTSREAVEQMRWTKEDRMCIALPMFHCFGLSVSFFASLHKGFCMYLLSGFHTSYVLKCVDQYKITILNGVPTMFLALLKNSERKKYDLTSLKSGIIAGSTVFKEDYIKICKELNFEKLQQSYGQTEASPSITFNNYNDPFDIKCVSVGKALPNVKLKIISTGEDKFELKPYETGEIIIKGYNVMHGYYKRPEQNCKKLKDGWLYTDDIGYVDNAGNLYITGRKQEVIIRSGENISPKEIEDVIIKYPNILQVKVFGISAPVVQEEIVACIVSDDEKIEINTLKDYLKKYLANYKVPKYIYNFERFPLNINGKVNVKQLKKEIQLRISKEENL